MKLEKLYYFPLLRETSLKKKKQRVEKEFSDVATLHFRSYSGGRARVAGRPVAEALAEAAPGGGRARVAAQEAVVGTAGPGGLLARCHGGRGGH